MKIVIKRRWLRSPCSRRDRSSRCGSRRNNPVNQVLQNPQYNADGTLVQSRLKPNAAGFGAVNGTTNPLTMQMQIRFSF